MGSHALKEMDYEQVRNGTTNRFVAVEPNAGRRAVAVTERRLNMAEIEIGIHSRQCLDRRIESRHRLPCEVHAW